MVSYCDEFKESECYCSMTILDSDLIYYNVYYKYNGAGATYFKVH